MGFLTRRKLMKALPPVPAPVPAPDRPTEPQPQPQPRQQSQQQAPPPPPVVIQRRPVPRSNHNINTPPPSYDAPQTSGITSTAVPSVDFEPAGYLPPPPGWNAGPPPPSYPQQRHQHPPPQFAQHQAPVVVNQHYYLIPAPLPRDDPQGSQQQGSQQQSSNGCALTKMVLGSAINLTNQIMPGMLPGILEDATQGAHYLNQSAVAVDQIRDRFNDIMTLIDRERYCGNEKELFICQPSSNSSSSLLLSSSSSSSSSDPGAGAGAGAGGRPHQPTSAKTKKSSSSGKRDRDHPKGQTTAVAATVISGNYFAKVELYANARLPMNLPPLKLYIPTWPLLCLAAQYSERVYDKPRGKEKEVQVDADSRTGTKAMVIKSVPMDHMNTIVFAIRGTSTFMDWAVNLNTAPTSPVGFLDDIGNYCHAGFLCVARRMIKPVAARLQQLLQEDPGRRTYSLLITGHSAGGAVASLLYSHMLATSPAAASELNALTGRFKRVHCVTFGTPPVTLLPLQKPAPDRNPELLRKSLFLSFVNEGDPVARADKAYVRSLLELFATPSPSPSASSRTTRTATATATATANTETSSSVALQLRPQGEAKPNKSKTSLTSAKSGKSNKVGNKSSSSSSSSSSKNSSSNDAKTKTAAGSGPVWKLPPSALSNAGRIVVLRSGDAKARLKGKKTVEERLNEGVVAQVATDEQLRTVIWGDPVCHLMKLYAGRLEMLAVSAVTAKGY